MCLIIEGVIPEADLECLKRLGALWNREIIYFPVFHPDTAEEIENEGFEGKPVKVTVRIEIVECVEEPEEEEKEES